MSANTSNAPRHKEFRRVCEFALVSLRSKQRVTLCADEKAHIFGQLQSHFSRCRFLYR